MKVEVFGWQHCQKLSATSVRPLGSRKFLRTCRVLALPLRDCMGQPCSGLCHSLRPFVVFHSRIAKTDHVGFGGSGARFASDFGRNSAALFLVFSCAAPGMSSNGVLCRSSALRGCLGADVACLSTDSEWVPQAHIQKARGRPKLRGLLRSRD